MSTRRLELVGCLIGLAAMGCAPAGRLPPPDPGPNFPVPPPVTDADLPDDRRCSFEYATDDVIPPRSIDEGANLRQVCEECESRDRDCWIRNVTLADARPVWAAACLERSHGAASASEATNVLCDRHSPPGIPVQLCKERSARKVRRVGVCAPPGSSLEPGDLSFEYALCGQLQEPCCGRECDAGYANVSRGSCLCTSAPPRE